MSGFGKRTTAEAGPPNAGPAPSRLAQAVGVKTTPAQGGVRPVAGPASPAAPPVIATPQKTAAREASAPPLDFRSEEFYRVKSTIFTALIETIDLAQLAQLDPSRCRNFLNPRSRTNEERHNQALPGSFNCAGQ